MPKMTDDRIVATIQYGVSMSNGFSESRLSKERERVQRFYDGELPRPAHHGDSKFVSRDVYEEVEGMKATVLEVFSGNSRPVQFTPGPDEDNDAAQMRTDYVHDVIFRQNRGFSVIRDQIGNALKNRNGICKVWWNTDVRDEEYTLEGPSIQEIHAFLSKHPDAKLTDADIHEDGVTIKRAVLTQKVNRSKATLSVLPPEEFGISPMAEDIHTADLVFHKKQVSFSYLQKQGYPKDVLDLLQDNDKLWMQMDPERIARFQQTDDIIGTYGLEDGQKSTRVCTLYECYLELDMDDTGIGQLYKVMLVGDKILDKERVDRRPFIVYTPLPRENSFWGTNFAKLLEDIQTAKTYLQRSVINHVLTTNNPRLQVVRGAVLNPRELMENRFGGLVNVTRPDGIVPLPQAGLNPFVMTTLQMLDASKEGVTGNSALAKGLDKDAISKQNSGDMVHELITVSETRKKIVARNFAENFLRDLYTEVYRLVLENEDREKIVQTVGGQWVPVDFTQWPAETEMTVSFALGYGEQEAAAQKWAGLHSVLSNIPALAGQYGPEQQYNVVRAGIEAGGLIKDIDKFLLPPSQAKPVPPDPLHQAEVAMKQADANAKNAAAATQQAQTQQAQAELQFKTQELQFKAQEMQLKLEEAKLKLQVEQAKATLEQSKATLEQQKLDLERLKITADIQIKKDQLAHKVVVDAAEIQLQNQALAQQKLQAEAMPTRS